MNEFIYRFAIVLASAYVFLVWTRDYLYFTDHDCLEKRNGAFAGATPAPFWLIGLGAFCGVALASTNTITEIALGVSDEQTKVSCLAIFPWLAAAFIEELVFRGYLYIHNRGNAALVFSAIAMSIIFALCHPYIWDYQIAEGASLFSGEWSFNFSAQPIAATTGIFACSLVFYTLRFCPQNVYRSLLPCVAAHFAYNLTVYVVKASQGFVEWSF